MASSACEITPSASGGEQIRLTELCRCAGCAAKIRAKDIEAVLRSLPLPADPRVIAGHQSADDAVVVQISPELALVQTVDFFPPVVDDPRRYGRIAAANSLSDVYAMGGTPLSAMNIACFPIKKYGVKQLSEILQGGLEKVLEAGAVLAGGHTVEDDEPKFGLAVTGTIDPRRIAAKGGAKAGDMLVLTKPLGTGVLNTALRAGDISDGAREALLTSMETLNKAASLAMIKSGVRGATDITGYGLLGHVLEMARASDVTVELKASQVPFLPEVMDAYQKMMATLLSYQHQSGLWGQVVDDAEFWEESSCSAMFAYAFIEGVRQGWLDKKTFGHAALKAWVSLCGKLDGFANISDVCIGTNWKDSREWYMNRPRANGDPHGQAALMWMCNALTK